MPAQRMPPAQARVLFTLPIGADEGVITVSEPAEKVYLLAFGYGADNRLTSVSRESSYPCYDMISLFLSVLLDLVSGTSDSEADWEAGETGTDGTRGRAGH